LAGLTCLRGLDLSACGLRRVPDAILGLSSLTNLCLRSNRLKGLPVGPYLHNLTVLVLVNNKFACVPLEAVQAATGLTCLSMGGNPLELTAAEAEAVKLIKVLKVV
jgi:Leucine-rich repeat (LRR) protein